MKLRRLRRRQSKVTRHWVHIKSGTTKRARQKLLDSVKHFGVGTVESFRFVVATPAGLAEWGRRAA
jgi:hypothetical protein